MITEDEKIRINKLKVQVRAGLGASDEEKQWILNIIAREHAPVREVVMVRAKNEGFATAGIVTY